MSEEPYKSEYLLLSDLTKLSEWSDIYGLRKEPRTMLASTLNGRSFTLSHA